MVEQRRLVRTKFWQGQRLRADDFRVQEASDEQRRWWHNRSLHDAYGVARGLRASLDGHRLRITRGLAYDVEGRELIVDTDVAVVVPDWTVPDHDGVPESRVLVVAWPRGSGSERVSYLWIRLSRFVPRDGVPLALVDTTATGVVSLDDTFEPPDTRPQARAHTGSGMTTPGGTPWELWVEPLANTAGFKVLGIQVRVDTSAAGFAVHPVYGAQLQTPGGLDRRRSYPPLLCHIAAPSPDGFLFRIWTPDVNEGDLVINVRRTAVVGVDGTTVTVADRRAFAVGDIVRKRGGGTATVVSIGDGAIELDTPIRGLAATDVLQSDRLASVGQLGRLLAGTPMPGPGARLRIEGRDAGGRKVAAPMTIAGHGAEGVMLDAPAFPRLTFARGAPRLSILSEEATAALALEAQRQRWHVSWLGLVSEPRRPEPAPVDDALAVLATEVG